LKNSSSDINRRKEGIEEASLLPQKLNYITASCSIGWSQPGSTDREIRPSFLSIETANSDRILYGSGHDDQSLQLTDTYPAKLKPTKPFSTPRIVKITEYFHIHIYIYKSEATSAIENLGHPKVSECIS
jgi:hypothetical protein